MIVFRQGFAGHTSGRVWPWGCPPNPLCAPAGLPLSAQFSPKPPTPPAGQRRQRTAMSALCTPSYLKHFSSLKITQHWLHCTSRGQLARPARQVEFWQCLPASPRWACSRATVRGMEEGVEAGVAGARGLPAPCPWAKARVMGGGMGVQPAGAEAAPWRELDSGVGVQTAGAGAAARRAVGVQCWGRLAHPARQVQIWQCLPAPGWPALPLPLHQRAP